MRRPCSFVGSALLGATVLALSCAPPLKAVPFAGQATPGLGDAPAAASQPAPVPANADATEPKWQRLVLAHIDESLPAGQEEKSNYFTTHPVDLMIPAGWKLQGLVDWPQHKGRPSLTFRVDSPDGQTSLEYLPDEGWEWSEDAATRASLQALGAKVQPMHVTQAAAYLRAVLLPRLRPDAQVIAIDSLPQITGYLNRELEGTNIAAETGAKQTGTVIPRSSADAARARLRYVSNGVPVEEWVEVAVEHRQRHADNTPPWRACETGRLYVAPSGPMIDSFNVIECDVLRAPSGALETSSRLLGSILGQLQQNGSWTTRVSYEHWHGKYNDRVYYFQRSLFGDGRFTFQDPSNRESYSFAYRHAWRNEDSSEFIVTDSADFDPNGSVGTQSWTRLKQQDAE